MAQRMVRAVIFDVDGTLVDSVDLHAAAWHKAFLHFGYHVRVTQIRAQIGKGGDKLMPVFLSKQDLQERGEDIEKFRGELFKRDYMPRVRPFPKVRELLVKIRSAGQKTALASSSKKDQLQRLKKIARIDDVIDCETSADDIEASKPDPDVFHAALKCLDPIRASETVVVGDTPYDASAAAKAAFLASVCFAVDSAKRICAPPDASRFTAIQHSFWRNMRDRLWWQGDHLKKTWSPSFAAHAGPQNSPIYVDEGRSCAFSAEEKSSCAYP